MEYGRIERWKLAGASLALVLGTVGLAACGNEEAASQSPEPEAPSETEDLQKKISDWIGKQAGLYDEDGNVIPIDERTD